MQKKNNYESVEINPINNFKNMLKGTATARNLSFVYVLISLLLSFKMREQIEYIIPLLLGALLIFWYTATHLFLKNINLKTDNLINQFKLYKTQTLKRDKYESLVYFVWILTLIPAFVHGQEITLFVLLKWMVIIYAFTIIGNSLFKKLKSDLIELESQINAIEANSFASIN